MLWWQARPRDAATDLHLRPLFGSSEARSITRTPPPHNFRCARAHRRRVKGSLPSLLQGSREWSCPQPRRFLLAVHNRWEVG